MGLEVIKKIANEPNGLPPLLFVHGAWHGAWYWDVYFLDFFQQKGFDVYALSLSHHGGSKSAKVLNLLSIQDYVADVREVVETMEQVPVLIGHSMGGFIVQKYLEKYSCRAAILLATAPAKGAWATTFNFIKTFPISALTAIATLSLFRLVNSEKKARWAFYEDGMPSANVKLYADQLKGESFLAYLGLLFPAIKLNYHHKIPMLSIAGGKDRIFSVKSNQATAEKYKADFKLFSTAAHNIMLGANWKEVATYMMEWMRGKI